MKVNQDKCHLPISKNEDVSMYIGPFEIKITHCEKLLGIKVDSKLNFNEHLDCIIKRASRKINAISRITPLMNISKKALNDLTIVLWVRFFKVVQLKTRLTVYTKEFCVLHIVTISHPSEKDGTVSIHVDNLQILATEMFKISKNFSFQM